MASRLGDSPLAPRVAVTGARAGLPFAWWATWAVLRVVGGSPVRLSPGDLPELAGFDALVVGGGDDIAVALYDPSDVATRVADPERDAFEVAVLREALQRDLPVLGICRGAQLLNVVLGGTLHRDLRPLRRRVRNRATLLPTRYASVAPGSRLASVVEGASALRINALHNQAVRDLGTGLRASARDLDGFIQCVEDPGRAFRMGVQWHPEYLGYLRRHRRLFAQLVRAAGANAEAGSCADGDPLETAVPRSMAAAEPRPAARQGRSSARRGP